MHKELAASLRHVCERSRGIVAFDEEAMEAVMGALERGVPYPPDFFARYYALVEALLESDHDRAARRFREIATGRAAAASQVVGPLEDPRTSPRAALFVEWMTADPGTEIGFLPPAPETWRAFADRYRAALALVDEAVPELAGEVRGIVREVVLVESDPACAADFHGGSHFQLWGALFLNAALQPTVEDVVEVVAHESAHSFLFGCCTEEPLVHNADEELFPSPLREDLRPMDGIYHATFVSARMHWALSRLLESGRLSGPARDRVAAARDDDRRNFLSGHAVVAEHGLLSETGEALMTGAREYMERAAS